MHIIQQKIIELAERTKIKNSDFRQLGRLIGEKHPFKISYHINQLIKNKLIRVDKNGFLITMSASNDNLKLFSIPVLGEVTCGSPTIFAEINFSGYIQISKSLFKKIKETKNIIAVKAFGNSMNKANINGKNIEEGDYILVDASKAMEWSKYVLAINNGCAIVKRLYKDEVNKVYSLVSESTETHPPIFINADNDEDTFINGNVIDVIKTPKIDTKKFTIELIEQP